LGVDAGGDGGAVGGAEAFVVLAGAEAVLGAEGLGAVVGAGALEGVEAWGGVGGTGDVVGVEGGTVERVEALEAAAGVDTLVGASGLAAAAGAGAATAGGGGAGQERDRGMDLSSMLFQDSYL
jgi:hypothetical protein